VARIQQGYFLLISFHVTCCLLNNDHNPTNAKDMFEQFMTFLMRR